MKARIAVHSRTNAVLLRRPAGLFFVSGPARPRSRRPSGARRDLVRLHQPDPQLADRRIRMILHLLADRLPGRGLPSLTASANTRSLRSCEDAFPGSQSMLPPVPQTVSNAEERVIVATGRYFGEGFDDARLDTLLLTMPISWRGTLAQYAGRLHRQHTSKRNVIIYDYVDENEPMLAKMAARRSTGYRNLGYRTAHRRDLSSEAAI